MEMLVFNGKLYFLFHFLQCIQYHSVIPNQTWTQRAPGKLAVINSNSCFYLKTIATTGPRPASPAASKRSEQVKPLFDLTWRWVAHSAVWNLSDAKSECWDSKLRLWRKNRGQRSRRLSAHVNLPISIKGEAFALSSASRDVLWGCGRLAFLALVATPACLPGCFSSGYKGRIPLPPARVTMKVLRSVVQNCSTSTPPSPPPPSPSFIYNFKKAVWFTGQKLPVPPGDPRRRPRQNKIQRNVSGGESRCNRSEGLGIQIRARKNK